MLPSAFPRYQATKGKCFGQGKILTSRQRVKTCETSAWEDRVPTHLWCGRIVVVFMTRPPFFSCSLSGVSLYRAIHPGDRRAGDAVTICFGFFNVCLCHA